jgi:hypothetical protein
MPSVRKPMEVKDQYGDFQMELETELQGMVD